MKKALERIYKQVVKAVRNDDTIKLFELLENQDKLDFLWEVGKDSQAGNDGGAAFPIFPDKKTVFHLAAHQGSCGALAYLVKRGETRALVCRDKDGWTPLHYAAHEGHLSAVRILIEAGSPILRDNKGKTPMFWTGRKASDLEVVSVLLDATVTSGVTSNSRALMRKDSRCNLKRGTTTISEPSKTSSRTTNRSSSSSSSSTGSSSSTVGSTRSKDADSGLEDSATESMLNGMAARHERAVALQHASSAPSLRQSRESNSSSQSGSGPIAHDDLASSVASDSTHPDSMFFTSNLEHARNPRARKKSRRAIGRRSANVNESKEEGSWNSLHLFAINGVDEMELEKLCLRPNLRDNVDAAGECGLIPLHMAAMRGNIIFCEVFLQHGSLLSRVDSGGKTALHRAARCGRTAAVKYFIERGLGPDVKDNDGRTPLHDAAYNGHVETATVLLRNGADCNVAELDGSTPLLLSSYNGHVDMTELLLQNGADVNQADLEGHTALHDAADRNHLEVAEVLLDYKGRLDLRNERGRTALHAAAAHGNFTVCQEFVEKIGEMENAELVLNARDEDGFSALHDAVITGRLDLVDLLAKNGLDVNVMKGDHQPPLHCAAANGHANIVCYLVQIGARTNEGDSNGDTALHWAAFKGQAQCVRALLQPCQTEEGNDTDPHCHNADGGTALHSAANHGDVTTGQILLEFGASVDIQMDDGNASLHNAAYEGHHDFALMLLEHDASVDILNAEMRTPLHEAACMGHTHLCRLLLTYGARIDLQDGGGDTALHWAVCNGHAETASFLLTENADMSVVNVDGGSPLHAALINAEEECVSVLIKAGACVNAKMETIGSEGKSDSCLHVAAAEGLTSCVKMLMEAGASASVSDAMGRTPLHEAIRRRHLKAAWILINNGANLGAVDKRGCVALQYALGRRPDLLRPLAENLSSIAGPPEEWKGFAHMFDSEQFSDVIIVCQDGEEIFAHKIVLCSRCEPFRAMFSHSFREAGEAKVKLHYPYAVIRVLFEYLYSGSVDHESVSPEVAMQCVQLADQYTLERLKTICGCILEDSLDHVNVIEIFTFAKYHGARNLQLACMDFFLRPKTQRALPSSAKSYKEMIDDILNKRWKSLGVQSIRKVANPPATEESASLPVNPIAHAPEVQVLQVPDEDLMDLFVDEDEEDEEEIEEEEDDDEEGNVVEENPDELDPAIA